ncbi:MAG: sugar ABC transporter permease [Armatimonadota bacterium]|nr:sugar ABC transporter permease [Armatimonadota bacterium]MDR7401200.1 sugar ABC transporter permease [Armatimonadota bacterium]MDR7403040.1 sugar ABC transporter permease [Armatimonadota bacterium]MDR7437741.1 sugar ABC transporter permease [Armatimonadota bacterium]MDR7471853.1 sugar ABC transporter permease [Armatimonadota bacterium]
MSARARQTVVAYLFLLPALALLGIFTVYPVLVGTVLSLFDYDVLSPPRYVGLRQFQRLLADRYFWTALANSARYVLVVPVIQLCSLVLAVAVNRPLRGIRAFRAAYYIPVITSWPVAGIVWTWMYDQQGVVNFVLRALGVLDRPFSWLTHPTLALYAVMFVTLWKGLGWYMVIYLAGLQAVPPEYEEAAHLDGASRSQVFWRITVPLLRPYLLLGCLLSTMAAVKVFEEIYVMTRGGPFYSTYTMFMYIFDTAFEELDMGYAAALALVLAAVLLAFSAVNVRLFRHGGLEGYE